MLVTMSDKELSRINVIQSVVEKRMLRRNAAHQLNNWLRTRWMNWNEVENGTGVKKCLSDVHRPVFRNN
ncbi:hypothetical protein LFZ50_20210 [Salmonella enterica subsp. arizonae serovar 53:-:- str. SA20100345]|nr:hypothetical protein LFZ50_20210 [Salmonella enterica subsp. arizonae serovar 53:-:- str. SA20100345]